MHRLLLDTNILLDCIDPSRASHDETMILMARCNGGGDMGIASSHSLNDAYHIMKRLYDEPTARNAVRVLSELVVVAPVSAEETLLALDSMQILSERGISVPRDLLMCGFDDSAESRNSRPPLTTIHIHTQVMAFSAVQLLMTRIKEPSLDYRIVHTQTDLIRRESTTRE